MVFAGWSAIAAAVLTVIGLVTLVAFFATGNATLGRINDLSAASLALATVPVALALWPPASRASVPLATGALAADLVGAALASAFSVLLVLGVMTFSATLLPVTIGNALIGAWLVTTAGLLMATGAVPAPLAWLGAAGGAGLTVTSLGFVMLGRESVVVSVTGLVAVVGLVAFYSWIGILLIRGQVGT